jgi:hypothetical protein
MKISCMYLVYNIMFLESRGCFMCCSRFLQQYFGCFTGITWYIYNSISLNIYCNEKFFRQTLRRKSKPRFCIRYVISENRAFN